MFDVIVRDHSSMRIIEQAENIKLDEMLKLVARVLPHAAKDGKELEFAVRRALLSPGDYEVEVVGSSWMESAHTGRQYLRVQLDTDTHTVWAYLLPEPSQAAWVWNRAVDTLDELDPGLKLQATVDIDEYQGHRMNRVRQLRNL
jgi:uncharacterized protein (DUF736 family)